MSIFQCISKNFRISQGKSLPLSWFLPAVCLAIVLAVGIVFSANQTSSAGSAALPLGELLPSAAQGYLPEIERSARSLDKLASRPTIWPTTGEVTSTFGWRNSPWGGGKELHQGIDIANSMGTPIVAVADGDVVQSTLAGGYGNVVQIDHGNGIVTIYGHNSRLLAQVGDRVRKGQVIAYMGSTGRSTGPHVHYEIRINGTSVDPMVYLVQY